ncbi:MAG TPA: hypothetical protein VLU06_10750 [Thermoanaerobaculia bacterium]|nr:hypothetical protein [Thermoanaerobaculia bacterium]
MKPQPSTDREPGEGPDPGFQPLRQKSHPERICPTCGAMLLERKCELLCPDPACGYYMSCSDFY